MKCESNRIGEWLDSHYDPECQYYSGAIDALKVAGFKLDVVPCGHGAIHIVNPPDKVISVGSNGEPIAMCLDL